jgi:hypothetical protein
MKEKPTSGSLCDKVFYEDVPEVRETRFVVRFMMTPQEAITFMEEMVDRGAIRIRAESNGNITFIETSVPSRFK